MRQSMANIQFQLMSISYLIMCRVANYEESQLRVIDNYITVYGETIVRNIIA